MTRPFAIITLDGPAGSGKSTAARQLAARLGYDFLDTGAMYRAVAWKCLGLGLQTLSTDEMGDVARNLQIEFDDRRVLADGVDVTDEIRSEEVSVASSMVAVNEGVRSALVQKQRDWAKNRNVVSEGRDQGTIVFPHADCKFFVTASPEIRAQRRYEELSARGESAIYAELLQRIRERDLRDANRELAPLKPADDALFIDTSNLPLDAVVAEMEAVVRRRLGGT